jgi:predicted RNA-binding Zn-ribbon protein involved in translation (DUF1610 family)
MPMQSSGAALDYDVELSEQTCPNCGHEAYRRDCECEDGLGYHDCGEDSCCCLDDSPNVRCDWCLGRGEHVWCRRCGWDLLEKRFLNGHDERTVEELQEDRAR